MKTKILIAVLSIGLFTMSTVKAQEKPKMKVEQMEKTAFSCPMQCEGEKTYDKPGSCPKCKMDLKKVADAKSPQCCSGMKAYTCPMHADVKSDKPGACPKCKMDLKKVADAKSPQCCAGMKTDSAKMECGMNSDKSYACPMHADVKTDKPGACPKCGMDLKKIELKK